MICIIVFFFIGASVTFSHRVDKTPPKQLTLENYQDFVSFSANVGNISGGQVLSADGSICVETFPGYTVYDLQVTVLVSTNKGTLTNNQVTINLMKIKGRTYSETVFTVKLSLPNGADWWTGSLIMNETRDLKCNCEVVSISGRIAYEK